SASRTAGRCSGGRSSRRPRARWRYSYDFGERITQAVEQPVAADEEQHRTGAHHQQPSPVADRTVEEEDFLVRHREVGERVQIEQEPEPLDVVLKPGVDDRRGEEPE